MPAFVVGLAMMLNGVGLGSAVKGVFDDVAMALGGNKYAPYFQKWHDKKSAWLSANVDNAERLKADQEALATIARAFIGLDEDGVKEKIKELANPQDGNDKFSNVSEVAAGEGDLSGTLVPLSYSKNLLDSENGYVWLDQNNNLNTINLLSVDAQVYGKGDTSDNNPLKGHTNLTDRVFYSDDMIGNSSNTRMVTLQVHYNNGTVDYVNIQARKGHENSDKNNDSKIVSGLNLTNVTKTGYTVVE